MSRGEKAKVLVVDDEPKNLQLLRHILKDEYDLIFAKDGRSALLNVAKHLPNLILLDVMMPGINGYQVLERLKEDHRFSHIPIIFCTANDSDDDESRGLELGAVDYIIKPFRSRIIRNRVRNHLNLHSQSEHYRHLLNHQHQELIESRLRSLQMLGKAAEYRDNETGLHVIRMSHYAEIIARGFGWNQYASEQLLHVAPMHDIGKIGTPDHILRKPGKLNAQEWQEMKQHPVLGSEIIGCSTKQSTLFAMARAIALTHHERWDGQGYPHNLKGEDIPIEGRMVAIADVFDALTTKRPYKEAWSFDKSVGYISEQSGTQFDPALVPVFLNQLDAVKQVMQQYHEVRGNEVMTGDQD
ncbi:MAG: response regulator [Gammaproteobacteria bacterium]|nr:response regulator [Gammaproteobacteria bacterium]